MEKIEEKLKQLQGAINIGKNQLYFYEKAELNSEEVKEGLENSIYFLETLTNDLRELVNEIQ